ncbi:MAG: RpiB/LacA/LacB family sugar-phosphate isomerase [Patescibacteria group bacterium]|jgi:ribose 5-phosphate isomerase B
MAAKKRTIYLASDHAGFKLKEAVVVFLRGQGHEVRDLGAFSAEPSDYPDFIIPAAEAVAKSRGKSVGIFFGGSGIGECLAASKVAGIRGALVYDAYSAKFSREHNDANVMCLGARTPSGRVSTALRLIRLWLATSFSDSARHRRRLKQIHDYEQRGRCLCRK